MEAQMLIGVASIITSLGAIGAVLVALKSLDIAKKSFLADHERRKKQATIEFYDEISVNASIPLREAISKALGKSLADYSYKQIHPSDTEWINNTDLQYKFINYCRKMERFATGIAIGIYDFDTFNKFSGRLTARLFEQIKYLIEDRNKKHEFCTEFNNFYYDLLKSHAPSKQSEDEKEKSNIT